MKIFNWVHRRFYNKENGKKMDEFEVDEKTKCINEFEGWGGGILSIGTFGYDDHHPSLKDEDIDDDGDEIVAPVLLQISDHEEAEQVDDEEEEDDDYLEGIIEREEIGLEEYVRMEKRGRTTLADLFMTTSTDHHDSKEEDNMKKHQQPGLNKHMIKSKSKKSKFIKKIKLEEAAQPIHKLTHVMRKMLKRKIHPEVGVANSKLLDVSNDHASLLPTQDAII